MAEAADDGDDIGESVLALVGDEYAELDQGWHLETATAGTRYSPSASGRAVQHLLQLQRGRPQPPAGRNGPPQRSVGGVSSAEPSARHDRSAGERLMTDLREAVPTRVERARTSPARSASLGR